MNNSYFESSLIIEQALHNKRVPLGGPVWIPPVWIPRYLKHDDVTTDTIQDYGWHPGVEPGRNHLVHFCNKCQRQRTFTIVSEQSKISKNGREYVSGYYGFCDYCKENER